MLYKRNIQPAKNKHDRSFAARARMERRQRELSRNRRKREARKINDQRSFSNWVRKRQKEACARMSMEADRLLVRKAWSTQFRF